MTVRNIGRHLLWGAVAVAALSAGSRVIAQQAAGGIARVASRPPGGPPPDAEMVKKGDVPFQQVCAACHGANGRGGPGGGIDLTASAIAMAADGGRELGQFLQVGRPEKGMPPFPLNEAEAADLSAKLRALGFAAAPSSAAVAAGGAPATGTVLVGDAGAGKAFFNGPVGRCASCHAVEAGQASPAANLAHVATKYPEARVLQNTMLLNRTFFWSPANSKDVTATITFRDGRTVRGYLSSVSDFKVIVRDEAGKETILDRRDGEPKVVLTDRMQAHLDLLRRYRDSDIHDLTAYLVTLK